MLYKPIVIVNMISTKRIIIIGLTPQGLSLLRTLSRAGVSVVAFYQNVKNVGVYSKYGQKIHFDDVDDLKSKISAILENVNGKPRCFITSGELLALILREYPELYNQCDVSSGPYDVIEMLAHKDRMYELAIKKGFKVAKYTTLDHFNEDDFTYPLFMKRNYEIPLFFKAEKIETPEVMNHYLSRIKSSEKKDIIVQEWINIPKTDVINITAQSYYVNGTSKGYYVANQVRRLKKGITSYIEEITDHLLVESISKLAEDFMKELKYNGFAEFEFMYNNRTKELYFIEVNTRTCGSQSSLACKFRNLADVVLNNEETLQPNEKPVRWMNILRDVRSRFETNDFRGLTDIFHSSYDILDWCDLKPFIKQIF